MSNNTDIDTKEASAVSHSDSVTAQEPESNSKPIWKKTGALISKIIYRTDRIFGDIVAITLGLGIAALWIACSVLDKQSTDLTVLRPNFKIWFADAFNGRDSEFGRLELSWQPVDDRIVVTIEDAEVLGSNGEVLERFDLVKSTFDVDENFFLLPRLVNAQVKGGVLTYIQNAEGQVTMGLGPPEAVGRVGPVYRSGKTSQSTDDILSLIHI